ncbi:hypothetical protein [Variovorax saccharolyticus]|uniref:hypothetical protein n=1 Tax=Variovorax saccharolyticus TaxID=3053516 RepID=UPI0025753D6C|nr:hypothetical protein [Variovorax sp. J31P216]MDM0024072.1 hypothetical protein [Variovorax sp. J31P216]
MTTIALPTGFVPSTFALRSSTVQRAHSSPFGGSEQVVDLLNDRWMASMTLPPRTRDDAARIEAFIAAMRGMSNTADLWHFARPIPKGTMRGSPVLANPLFQADPNLSIGGLTPGWTLLPGDMIGCNGMLFQISAVCVANGAGQMNALVVNRARKGAATGTAVTWDRPKVPFRLISTPSVQYVPGYAEGVALDFAEVVS